MVTTCGNESHDVLKMCINRVKKQMPVCRLQSETNFPDLANLSTVLSLLITIIERRIALFSTNLVCVSICMKKLLNKRTKWGCLLT